MPIKKYFGLVSFFVSVECLVRKILLVHSVMHTKYSVTFGNME